MYTNNDNPTYLYSFADSLSKEFVHDNDIPKFSSTPKGKIEENIFPSYSDDFPEYQFLCNYCDKRFPHDGALEWHIEKFHKVSQILTDNKTETKGHFTKNCQKIMILKKLESLKVS